MLAAIGLYGVMAYSVALRRTEIGIRAALGATPRKLFGEVTREGVTLAAVGAAVGLVAALGVTRLLRSMLYGVPPSDPMTFILAALVLIGAPGTGKSSVLEALMTLLEIDDVEYGAMESEQLSMGSPKTACDVPCARRWAATERP